MKLREFWIEKYSETYNSILQIDPVCLYGDHWRDKTLHVREVSPELDATIAECEKALEMNLESNDYIRKNERLSDGSVDGVDRVIEMTEKALAALRKARRK